MEYCSNKLDRIKNAIDEIKDDIEKMKTVIYNYYFILKFSRKMKTL